MEKRKVFQELLKQKDNKKVSILLGARQVGKTTILKALYENICVEQKNKGAFLDLDVFSNFEKVSSFENLINFIRLSGYEKEQFFYLFFDEFQRYGDLSMVMKNVYDNLDNVKIYASGSSSLKIKSQIQESLAGRKNITLVYPLDFEEFLWFKHDADAVNQLTNIHKLNGKNLYNLTSRLQDLLNEFLVFGGYPEVVLQKNVKDKITVLESIFDLYVKKDLVEYLNVKKILNVKKLIEYLAINNGQKIKYEELNQISSLDYREVRDYIEVIKETHIITVLKPFFTNKNKELVKIPKIYFIDNGVRNFFINNFNPPKLRGDSGFLFEGYIISEFLKSGLNPKFLRFWQDKNKHEIDIIVDSGQTQIPVEIKFKLNLRHEDFTAIRAFISEYPDKNAYIINPNIQGNIKEATLKLPFDFCHTILPNTNQITET